MTVYARKPKHLASPEAKIQKDFFFLVNSHILQYPELTWMHAIPNGALRNPTVARELAAQGVRSGVADVFLPLRAKTAGGGGYSGLYIELKTEKGVKSENQREFQEFVSSQGFLYLICRSAESAWEVTEKYVKLSRGESLF